jgi:hypothetical protein
MSRARDNARGAMPGNVIQVRNFQITDAWTSSGTSERITPITGTITPVYSDSNILVMINSTWGHPTGANHFSTKLRRTISGNNVYVGGATNFGNRISGIGGAITNSYFGDVPATTSDYSMYDHSLTYLDSPATTSQITYTLTVLGYGVTSIGASIFLNRTRADREGGTYDPRQTSSITLMEIKQ